jgi:multidrug resistance efflux pump
MSRLRLIPLAAGVCLLVTSLVGARLLQNPPDGSPGGPAADPKKGKPAASADSLVQPGTVDSETPLVTVTAPDHLPYARVAEVAVKPGQAVKPGDVLLRFDDGMVRQELPRAEAGVRAALKKKEEAEQAVREQDLAIEAAKKAVKVAEDSRDLARQARDVAERAVSETNRLTRPVDPQGKPRLVAEDPDYIRTNAALIRAEGEVEQRQIAVRAEEAKKARFQIVAGAAAEGVAVAQADLDKVRFQIDRCVQRADVAGTVERVEAVKGQVVGPTTRVPLLYVVPDGPRVVRVKVVPEFAYRVQDKVGRAVTVQDESNASLTYPGTVRRIGSAFLPDRGAGPESILAKPAPVLEVTVEVTDPAPAGKPPLLIGQPVRVNFQ